jgi:hypothetical protein
MAAVDENLFPKIILRESANDGSDFSNPAADYRVAFLGEDGLWHLKDSAGTVTDPYPASSGIPATIFDAAGDIIVASAADTAARLAKGAAGGALSIINAAVAWNSGTSFPGSVVTGDRYWRTDLAMEFYYDGTRWVTTQLFTLPVEPWNIALGTGVAATQSGSRRASVPPLLGGSDIWLISSTINFYINAGTALDGSHNWVGTFVKADSAGSETTVATHTINSGASSAFRLQTVAIGALLGTSSFIFSDNWTKTGTPGNNIYWHDFSYRIVAT